MLQRLIIVIVICILFRYCLGYDKSSDENCTRRQLLAGLICSSNVTWNLFTKCTVMYVVTLVMTRNIK